MELIPDGEIQVMRKIRVCYNILSLIIAIIIIIIIITTSIFIIIIIIIIIVVIVVVVIIIIIIIIASWIHSYFDNVMTKFMINNRTDA